MTEIWNTEMSVDSITKSSRAWTILLQCMWSTVTAVGSPVRAVEQFLLSSMAQGFLTHGHSSGWAPWLGASVWMQAESFLLCISVVQALAVTTRRHLSKFTCWWYCVILIAGAVIEEESSWKWEFLWHERIKVNRNFWIRLALLVGAC